MFDNEPEWMKNTRKEAEKQFQELPMKKSKYAKINTNFEEIIKNIKSAKKNYLKAEKSTAAVSIIQVNNDILEIRFSDKVTRKGIIVESFQDALKNHEPLVRKFYENMTVKSDTKLNAFNFAFLSSGLFIHVPEDVQLGEISYSFIASDSITTVSQVLILAEKNSQLTFSDHSSSDNSSAFYSSIIEIHLQENAKVNYISLQNFQENVTNIINRRALVSKNAEINWNLGQLGGKLSRTTRDTILAGEGSGAEDVEIFLGSGNQEFDITANILHKVPNTNGNVLVKGVLLDNSHAISQGMIKVDKNAQKTNSYLSEHTLLLNKNTRSDAVPGLEIEANDVKASHSASVSQIDGEQIFYLMSRGLTRNEAKKAISLGFLESAFQKVSSDFSNQFKYVLEEKWSKVIL